MMRIEKHSWLPAVLWLPGALFASTGAATVNVENQVAPVVVAESAVAGPSVDADVAKKGKRLYAAICARCHGLNLVNSGESTFNLREFPLEQKERFIESVVKGKRAMPAWGGILKPEEIEWLWAYINTRGQS